MSTLHEINHYVTSTDITFGKHNEPLKDPQLKYDDSVPEEIRLMKEILHQLEYSSIPLKGWTEVSKSRERLFNLKDTSIFSRSKCKINMANISKDDLALLRRLHKQITDVDTMDDYIRARSLSASMIELLTTNGKYLDKYIHPVTKKKKYGRYIRKILRRISLVVGMLMFIGSLFYLPPYWFIRF